MEASSSETTSVSVVITNYNYAQYLSQAIDSALAQTLPATEVIVVDDGSSDSSREVLDAYENSITVVLKENGGHGSAFNAGFAASSGDIVCFVDADDVVLPDKASKAAAEFHAFPNASVIYHQMRAIDAEGDLLSWPAWPRTMLRGTIRNAVERSGGWWPCPTTSALCFTRSFLSQVLPLPEDEFRVAPDGYLVGLAPFFGDVVGIDEPLTLYRIHKDSDSHPRGSREDFCRLHASRYQREFSIAKELLLTRWGVQSRASLNDHPRYQAFRRCSGEPVSITRVLLAAARCPVLPPAQRVREVMRILRGRDFG